MSAASHRCTEVVWRSGDFRKSRCDKQARHDHVGVIPTKCGPHSREGKARRKARREAKKLATYERREAVRHAEADVRLAEKNLETVLRQIAEGHGDPPGLAAQAIGRLDYDRCTLRAMKGDFG